MNITKDGEYQTRDGKPVRIYATDGGLDGDVVHGAYCANGKWFTCTWTSGGLAVDAGCPNPHDLMVKPKVRKLDSEAYVVQDMVGRLYVAGLDQQLPPYHRRIAWIHIQRDITEGEGLDA